MPVYCAELDQRAADAQRLQVQRAQSQVVINATLDRVRTVMRHPDNFGPGLQAVRTGKRMTFTQGTKMVVVVANGDGTKKAISKVNLHGVWTRMTLLVCDPHVGNDAFTDAVVDIFDRL